MSMITSCNNCGLPIFPGAAGYAGAQCRCGFSAKPNYDHNALAELLKERDQLKAENERLKEEVRSWVIRIQQRGIEMDELSEERDTLRKQLDEARELLTKYGYSTGDIDGRVDAWLERNKQ